MNSLNKAYETCPAQNSLLKSGMRRYDEEGNAVTVIKQ
jgi:hypothetical protein